MEKGQERPKASVNVQDSFFYAMRREGRPIHVYLLSGKRITGVLKRFDRYALIVESHGLEHLVYKHAMAMVCLARGDGDHFAQPLE